MENKVNRILKFSAFWCGPCKMLQRELEGFDLVPVQEIDVDENENMCIEYNIRNIPTLIFVNESGKEISRHVGHISKKGLEDLINELNE